ncbi:MAG: trypsin-like peptidase domain-containing protein [Nitrospirae bacterium]|nr:trypsin-like peptidase domain-containing protein [Nitrospirota bacterium]
MMLHVIKRKPARNHRAHPVATGHTWMDVWRGATVVLGHYHTVRMTQSDGSTRRRRRFVVVGSGLIAEVHTRRGVRHWLLTAKHIFCSARERWRPAGLHLLFPQGVEPRVEAGPGLRVRLLRKGRRQWFAHPNARVDLACVPIGSRVGPKSLPVLQVDRLLTQGAMPVGTPVVLLGYPEIGRGSYVQTLVRQGLVSWVSPNRPGSSPLLIDSHVFPGNSGGPVLALPHGFERPGENSAGEAAKFVGLATQSRILELPMLAGGKEVEIHFKGRRPSETLLAPQFVGIGVVEPAMRVGQLLAAASAWARRRRAAR